MVSCDTCFLTLVLVSTYLVVVSTDDISWDIAVANGQQVDLFTSNGRKITHIKVDDTEWLEGLAYDRDTKTMYMSGRKTAKNLERETTKNLEASIYSVSLLEKKFNPKTVIANQTGSCITAMAFDPQDRTLFWTDGCLETLMMMNISLDGKHDDPKPVFKLANHIPSGITLDVCNRYIYWANNHDQVHSIERSKLDGNWEREKIVDTGLYQVYDLAIDHSNSKLYWTDDRPGNTIIIESRNLDGTERKFFFNATGRGPAYIGVDKQAVYWVDIDDKKARKLNKNKTEKDEPVIFYSVYENSHSPLMSIITKDNVDNIDCNAMKTGNSNKIINPVDNRIPKKESNNPVENRTTQVNPEKSSIKSTNVSEEINTLNNNRSERSCFNNGHYNQLTGKCNCEKGFSGELCQINLCLNYCVHGTCIIDDKNSTRCECSDTHTGERCEKDICDGYCLNDGSCSVTNEGPRCKCENSWGRRCEYSTELDKLCFHYCSGNGDESNNLSESFCKCSKLNKTLSQCITAPQPLLQSTIILSVLTAVIGLLVIVVAVLSYHINKLRRRPRIRKRFVVSKGGVTPLTSRPQASADTCEITVENCCNMNICETPCFEPKLRTSPTKSNSTKKEEKSSLLDSMEGADSC